MTFVLFLQCGIALGTLLLVLCTLFTAWTCKMLMRAAVMTHNHSYENLGECVILSQCHVVDLSFPTALGVYGRMGKYATAVRCVFCIIW